MKLLRTIGLAVLLTGGAANLAQAQGKAPFEIVRSMSALQDQMVLGSTAAQAALPKLSDKIAGALLAAPAETWRDPRNARAAVIYTLAGGQPRVVKKLLEIGNAPAEEHRLMEGALAYLEGREPKAKQLLGDVEVRNLVPALGGHVALVQAALVLKEDPAKAMKYLDLARLVAPGTLVEEAALRREILLVDGTMDLDKFVLLSSQYLRRFQRSVYADNFRQRFSQSVVRLGILSDARQFALLERLMLDVDPEERLRLYLMVAQAAVVGGKIAVARTAAEKAAALAKDGSSEVARSQLYKAAAAVLTNNYDQGLVALQNLDTSQLPKRDVELRDAVVALARDIRRWPTQAIPGSEPSPSGAPETPSMAAASSTIDIAQKALSDTSGVVAGDTP